ncbi:MAG: prephenate dehydrogenase/arogenate dehydrogenase family protein [Candidatus Micrarchaeia archaeon]
MNGTNGGEADSKVSKELESLRLKIDGIDSEIVQLLAKRMEVVSEVGELKKKHGIAVTDSGREAKVVEKWEGMGHSLGLPPGLAGSVVSVIFPYSKVREVKSSRRHSICIIGYGSMAKVLAWVMLNAGNSVTITGRDSGKASTLANSLGCTSAPIGSAVSSSEYIVVALSPDAFESGFVENALKGASGKLVMDIASAKHPIYEIMKTLSESLKFRYVSTHPLFGGEAMPIGRKIAIISDNAESNTNAEEVSSFYSEMGITPEIVSLDEHEKAMAVVQVVPHFLTLSLEKAINNTEAKLSISSEKFSTPNLERVNALIAGVENNIKVVLEIQRLNKYAVDARGIAISSAFEVEKAINK